MKKHLKIAIIESINVARLDASSTDRNDTIQQSKPFFRPLRQAHSLNITCRLTCLTLGSQTQTAQNTTNVLTSIVGRNYNKQTGLTRPDVLLIIGRDDKGDPYGHRSHKETPIAYIVEVKFTIND